MKLRVDFMKDKESVKSGIKRKQNINDGAKQSIYMFEKSGKEKYDFCFRIIKKKKTRFSPGLYCNFFYDYLFAPVVSTFRTNCVVFHRGTAV